jgi:hypothetical protein
MPPAGFEPTIPSIERPKTHVLGRAATGIVRCYQFKKLKSEDISHILLDVNLCKKRINYLRNINLKFHLSTHFVRSWNFYPLPFFFAAKVDINREYGTCNLKMFRYVVLYNFDLMLEE